MRFKVVGGYIDLEPSRGVIGDLSAKLKAIANKEEKKKKEGAAFKEPTVKDLTTLKREGRPSAIIGGE